MDRSVFSAIDSIQSLIVLAIVALPAVARHMPAESSRYDDDGALVISPSVTDL